MWLTIIPTIISIRLSALPPVPPPPAIPSALAVRRGKARAHGSAHGHQMDPTAHRAAKPQRAIVTIGPSTMRAAPDPAGAGTAPETPGHATSQAAGFGAVDGYWLTMLSVKLLTPSCSKHHLHWPDRWALGLPSDAKSDALPQFNDGNRAHRHLDLEPVAGLPSGKASILGTKQVSSPKSQPCGLKISLGEHSTTRVSKW